MTADFPFNYVVAAGSHDLKDGDGLLPPNSFQRFGEGSHEEEGKDRGHVAALSYADCLRDFDAFVLYFEYANIVGVEGSDCRDEFWRSTVSFEDAKEEGMIGGIVSFNKVDETYV